MKVVNFGRLYSQEREFLDTLDLINIIDKNSSVDNNMSMIENVYGEEYRSYIEKNNLIHDDKIFTCLTEYEFISYFTSRYGCTYSEQVIHFFEM